MKQLSALPKRQSEPIPLPFARPSVQEAEETISLGELLDVVSERRWLIAAVTATAMALGTVYALLATPIYRADALVQVEEKSGGMEGLKELSAMFSGETPSEAEIELIRSRMVIGSVVERLGLDVVAEPRYFPVVGRALARLHRGDGPAAPRWGMSRFGWGGESLGVSRLQVPPRLTQVRLRLVADEAGRYTLYGPDGERLLEGEVGKVASTARPPKIEIFVEELSARPGTHFNITKLERSEAIRILQGNLRVSERGKKTGIIQLGLDGPDRERIGAIIDETTKVYLRQNVDRKSAEAEKTLEFVNAQLPTLKKSLDESEAELNAYRTQSGAVDFSLEAKGIIDQAAEVEKIANELKLKYAEVRQRFTESHPTLVALRRQLGQIESEQAGIEARMKGLPKTELASVRLMRDVKVANELYLLFLNKAQELRVMKSGTLGNVRIIDPAMVQLKPVSPMKGLIAFGSLLCGALLGLGLAFVQRALRRGVDDPSVLEQELGLSVYGSVPHSPKQAEMVRSAERKHAEYLTPLAQIDSSDLAIESLRSVRTSLQFALAEAQSNVIAIGGPRPGIGKSFVSVNLAHVLADSGKRILLVDADMRKGLLHRYFGVERQPGLSELIRGAADLESVARTSAKPGLSFISTGELPSNPSELLASSLFRDVVEQMKQRFDIVLLDAPPILAVTDAALVAQLAGVNLLVLKSGLHPVGEVALAISRLERSGARPNGFVFNAVQLDANGRSRNSYHYQYEYK